MKSSTLQPEVLRTLTLAPGAAGRHPHLSAASGLVVTSSCLYVVADDEHHLGVFPARGNGDSTLVRIVAGDLPRRKKPRKAQKPDFESLVRWPPFGNFSSGALLALGSGSRPTRRAGVLLAFDDTQALHGDPRPVDASEFFVALNEKIDEINIEGAFASGTDVVLLQRGNAGAGRGAVIRVPMASLVEQPGGPFLRRPESLHIHTCDLGAVGGVPLGFTDGAALPDGTFVFSAVAEATDDSYEDGVCEGSAVGVATLEGRVLALHTLAGRPKVEGVAAHVRGDVVDLLLVTDADDAAVPASVLALSLPGYPFL